MQTKNNIKPDQISYSDLNQKVVLITGASSGIGEAAAEMFIQQGAIVISADIVYKTVNSSSEMFIELDVSDESAWVNAIDMIKNKYHRLNVLVNNAGLATSGSVLTTSLQDWRRIMSVNLDGVFLGTKHSMPLMRESGGGSIINISSIAGLVGSPNAAVYCASKGGVRLFTKSVALECAQAKNNIRVNSIHPGGVDTPIWDKSPLFKDLVKIYGTAEKAMAKIAESTPLARFASAREIGHSILFLASDVSSYMTGAEVLVDGGYTAQ